MQIKILYFAQLADLSEKSEECLSISNNTPELLYNSLRKQYHFPFEFKEIQVAINHSLSAHDTELQEGDCIAFLPPMTGG